jgi:hypothetical protein
VLDRAGDPQSRLAKIADTCLLPVSRAGRMELITSETSVTDEVRILYTPGSVSVLVESGGEAAIFIGDVAHLCVQLTEFDWSPLGDLDRQTSPAARRRVVEEAVGRNALVAGPHLDEGPIFGRMVMLNGRRVWQGVDLAAQRETARARAPRRGQGTSKHDAQHGRRHEEGRRGASVLR